MQPADFYKEYFKNTSANKKTRTKYNISHSATKYDFYNGKLPMRYMNQLDINFPSSLEIQELQLQSIQRDFRIDPALSDMITKYNQDFENFGAAAKRNEFSLEHALEIVERVFANYQLQTDTNGDIKRNETYGADLLGNKMKTRAQLDQYKTLLNDLIRVSNILSKPSVEIEANEFRTYIQAIDKAINLLQSDVNSLGGANSGYIEDYKNPGYYLTSDKIIGLGFALKGRLVEIMSKDFIGKRLPDGFRIVDTAKINAGSFDIFGNTASSSGKQIRQDAIIFDIAKNITCTYTYNGQLCTKSLAEFLDDCDNASKRDEKIEISNEELNKLLDTAAVGAVQAKSGINQRPFNNFNVSINQAIQMGLPNIHAYTLSLLTQWYELSQELNSAIGLKTSRILANHQYYNRLFDYCISHNLTYVIGKKNTLLALRGRIVTTAQYFEEQLQIHGNYIKALKKVSLATPNANIPINLSKKEVF